MFSGQLERDIAMVEVVTVGVDPIVAGQAVVSISLQMGLHEIGLDLLVAGRADSLVKLGISICMTCGADKWGTI
jgi:hypothetical protein